MSRVNNAILILILLCAAVTVYLTHSTNRYVTQNLEAPEPHIVSTVTSSWTDAENIDHSVTTTRLDGESSDDFAARHKSDVDALKALFPPV